jgi:hypothetical protein
MRLRFNLRVDDVELDGMFTGPDVKSETLTMKGAENLARIPGTDKENISPTKIFIGWPTAGPVNGALGQLLGQLWANFLLSLILVQKKVSRE